MRDINRAFKILIKQYGMWILLFAVVLLVAQAVSVQSKLESMYGNMDKSYNEILLMDSISSSGNAPKWDSFKDVKREYNLGDLKKLNELSLKNFDKYIRDEFDEDGMTIENYIFFLIDNGEYQREMEEGFYNSERGYKEVLSSVQSLDGTRILIYGNTIVLFVAVVLGIALTSGEHLTPFYQFSRTLPWPRWKDLMAKTLLGGLTLILLYLLMIGVNYLMLMGSSLKELFTFNYIDNIYWSLITNLSTYFFILGIGCFAGNFIGHLGMLGMGFVGIDLYTWNFEMIYHIITRTYPGDIGMITRFSKQINQLPIVLRTMISPFSAAQMGGNGWAVGFLILGSIYLALGFIYHNYSNAERSGMMILNPLLSKFIFAMAVITTTAILSSMFFFIGSTGYGVVGYLAFALFFFISYKVYRVLFKIRIGI